MKYHMAIPATETPATPHITEGSTANSALHFLLPATTKVGLGRHATYSMRHSPLLVGLDLDLI